MNVTFTSINDLFILEPSIFGDERGFFLESWNENKFNSLISNNIHFVQDNHSKSKKNIIRGLHYQSGKPQGKLVRVVSGAVFDVAVDLRSDSVTFGQWFGIVLSAKNKKQLWIPRGFAHGFYTLEDNTEFVYKCDEYYDPSVEISIDWSDIDLNIKWPLLSELLPILSEKDLSAISFSQFKNSVL
ncbi:dTDP-4-dehydrorhamnose 3,5-epimerase [Photobacterium phosphoreum]|uniref:dTDP-4-dehydrorhamnose 3,5-epimerase n=1 Tax=Photobacterium phosphoreum TaxID=659 RepID=A0AAW4ZQX4_PHOPO|nr:dTDP-4-dehydrorhamnose 3,5-epimerase [Photobacterium phosphoreum]MCD9490695.1 dTDP-4-dehydrorhamnose 3,5-epimerase [Photobacterium phosphoreum]MCF2189961.1 dTDP-4-dehydrorhamnose 3,5-epimerase [Photobacterium phosphoreum]MCF2300830.1 dTDP-4-dehydrorhamnose 3,5-epimerase [Photobacterium phosphoreum]